VSHARQAQRRPRRLEVSPLKEAAEWLGRYRKFWDESFDRLDGYLAQLKQAEVKDDGDE
jgi:hypothetical protein